MDIEWGNPYTKQFATIVGLITTHGDNGDNMMACEWSHHASYSPGLMIVHIGKRKQTAQNILKSKEFTINLAGENHNVVSSISGKNSGSNTDKIAVLKELGVEFLPGQKTKNLILKDAVSVIECKLIDAIDVGDHMMFVGEILSLSGDTSKKPLIYHHGKYFKIGEQIVKPAQDQLDKISKLLEKHSR